MGMVTPLDAFCQRDHGEDGCVGWGGLVGWDPWGTHAPAFINPPPLHPIHTIHAGHRGHVVRAASVCVVCGVVVCVVQPRLRSCV